MTRSSSGSVDPRVRNLSGAVRKATVEQRGNERFAVITLLIGENELDDFADALLVAAQASRPYFDADLVNRQCRLGDYCKCCAGKPCLCPNYEGPGAP